MLGVVAVDVVAAETVNGLLTGRVRPESGEVLLGGEPLSSLSVASLRIRAAGRAAHGGPVRPSLAEAVDVGDGLGSRADDESAGGGRRRCARPTTWNRPLLDHGLNLSGGQRQRIALARALLADRTVLVLRDPTTAVDAVTENAIAVGIRALRHPEPVTGLGSGDSRRGPARRCCSPPVRRCWARATGWCS